MLSQAGTMLGKWRLLIFLSQQTILNLQQREAYNILRFRPMNYQPPQRGVPMIARKELLHCCNRRKTRLTQVLRRPLINLQQFFFIYQIKKLTIIYNLKIYSFQGSSQAFFFIFWFFWSFGFII